MGAQAQCQKLWQHWQTSHAALHRYRQLAVHWQVQFPFWCRHTQYERLQQTSSPSYHQLNALVALAKRQLTRVDIDDWQGHYQQLRARHMTFLQLQQDVNSALKEYWVAQLAQFKQWWTNDDVQERIAKKLMRKWRIEWQALLAPFKTFITDKLTQCQHEVQLNVLQELTRTVEQWLMSLAVKLPTANHTVKHTIMHLIEDPSERTSLWRRQHALERPLYELQAFSTLKPVPAGVGHQRIEQTALANQRLLLLASFLKPSDLKTAVTRKWLYLRGLCRQRGVYYSDLMERFGVYCHDALRMQRLIVIHTQWVQRLKVALQQQTSQQAQSYWAVGQLLIVQRHQLFHQGLLCQSAFVVIQSLYHWTKRAETRNQKGKSLYQALQHTITTLREEGRALEQQLLSAHPAYQRYSIHLLIQLAESDGYREGQFYVGRFLEQLDNTGLGEPMPSHWREVIQHLGGGLCLLTYFYVSSASGYYHPVIHLLSGFLLKDYVWQVTTMLSSKAHQLVECKSQCFVAKRGRASQITTVYQVDELMRAEHAQRYQGLCLGLIHILLFCGLLKQPLLPTVAALACAYGSAIVSTRLIVGQVDASVRTEKRGLALLVHSLSYMFAYRWGFFYSAQYLNAVMNTTMSYHDALTLLELSGEAPTEASVVKHHYRRQALFWHPDKCQQPVAECEAQMVKLEEAKQVLLQALPSCFANFNLGFTS